VAVVQVKPAFAPEELQVRRELAALYRVFHHYGWTDLTATHLSARLPDDPSHYLMNSLDFLFEEMSVSNLSKLSFDGRMVTPGRRLNQAGHLIHSSVLKARPEINFVLHSHTRAGTAVSAYPGGLLPLSQHAGVVLGTLATHPYQDSTAVEDEGALLARDLGQNYAMLLENHGLLTVGRTAAEAFTYHYYLEMACKIQVDILSMTDKPIVPPAEAMAPVLEWGNPQTGPKGDYYWEAVLRLVERRYPDYLD
jgi:ribulose-5-phosphate 4-epimerase/fuculose-1-phosphate aldolase